MKAFRIKDNDSVIVATCDISRGETVTDGLDDIEILSDIPSGHKIASRDIKENENVIKYGYPIGHAIRDIKKGEHVHTHNIRSNLSSLLEYTYEPNFKEITPREPKYFLGYRRPDNSVGIRNEIWIIPTVGCVNSIVREIERGSEKYKTENIDGIFSYNHPYGCSQLGDDLLMTLDHLAGLIKHPNAAGVLVVGLGCENGNIDELKKRLGDYDPNRVRFLVCQQCSDEISEGISIVKELAAMADLCRREKCPASELTVGLKCGGSDGFSGITANPLLGAFSDTLISLGGSTILTEVPEMFGAETILMNRCRSVQVFDKTVDLINGFKKYFMRYGEPIDENPSPGNKDGGISTLEDKSLGCTQKGGNAPVEDVLDYGEQIRTKGLSLLRAPGNDLVASEALAAARAQLILFTTGRGTPFGCPVPTVKISNNSKLAALKPSWIDFDAGRLLSGLDMRSLSEEFTDYVLSVASGEIRASSEKLDKHGLAIFKDGITL